MLLSRLWNELKCMSEEVSERRTAICSKRLVCHRTLFHILQVFYMVYQVVKAFDIINLLASSLTQPAVCFLLFNSCKAATTKIGCDACGGATAERVENPVALAGRGENNTDKQAQRFLRGMLSAGLLPSTYCWHAPHVGHLLSSVKLFHQFVVELVRHLFHFPRPYDELCGVFEATARDVYWRIGLFPSDDVQK